MNFELSELEKVLREVSIRYFVLIISVFLLFTIYFWSEDLMLFAYIAGISCLLHLILIFIPLRLNYQAIKPLIPVYLVAISLIVYPFVVLLWQIGQVTAFMWYLLIPFGAMLFFTIRSVAFWGTYVFILMCSILFVSTIVPAKYAISLTAQQSAIINVMTIMFCLFIMSYFLYYLNKINQLRMEKHMKYIPINNEVLSHEDKTENIEKYNELYNEIEAHFEKEKPYCDPDFTISHLAFSLNSNVNYISKAIKIGSDTNFSVFINTYRIALVKNLFDKGYQNTYTIKHIYTSAGFKQQTTFNKVFKQIEGITPTDYIKSVEINTMSL